MSPESTPSMPMTSDAAEPKAERAAVPVWLIVLFFLLLYWGMVYFDQRGAWFNVEVYAPFSSLEALQTYQPPKPGNELYDLGRKVYNDNCALCHNTDGTGKPNQAPPFVGSEWVLSSPNRLIRIPQNGLIGPIPLKGEVWNQAPSMPAMGAALKDYDLAAVLTYIRQSWGNKAPDITPEQVKAVRAEVRNRTQPWTAEELQPIP